MDTSDNLSADSAPSRSGAMLRALLSAASFGTLGGWLGKALGKRSNAEGNRVVERGLKWGISGFSAILAAYSSFKADEKTHVPASQEPVRDASVSKSAEPIAALARDDSKIPLSAIHGASIEQGKVKEESQLPPLQK